MSANGLRCFVLVKLLFIVFIFVGCTPSDKNAETLVNESSNSKKVATTFTQEVSPEVTLNIAPTVDKSRSGLWLGGSPPINKRSSRIDTFYKITQGDQPNHLWVTLQIEGAVYDDAFIKFNAIDGAEVVNNQPIKWLLEANAISEITFEVKVPETVSYLTLFTFQNSRGASRAFILEPTKLR